jgi:RNA polymerase sigma factor (sigma-70 family)
MANDLGLFVQRLRTLLDPARHESAPDGQLLARWAADRDSHAFAALVWRHGGIVWQVGRGVLRQREDAEDVFQATFLVLARKAGSLRGRESVAGWLHQTAYRLALKTRTATARRLRREDQTAQITVADPLEELTVREARTILAEELRRLPASYREPLLLCLYEGATQDEAARQLGCSLSTLKRRLERSRELLAERLSRRGLVPESTLAMTPCIWSKVPLPLVHQTLIVVNQFVAGEAVTGAAVGLAQGMLRMLLVKKLAICCTAMLALGGLTLAGGLAFVPAEATPVAKSPALVQTPKAQEQPKPVPPLPRLDRDGDALPPGALNRLGSQAFRHPDVVHALVYAPDGKAIASACADGVVRLWDAATGKLRWRLEADVKQDSFPGFRRAVSHVLAFSSDGKKLAMLNPGGYTVLDTVMNKVLVRHKLPAQDKGGEEAISSAIAADLTTLAIGFDDGSIHLVDAATGQEKMRFKTREKVADTGSPVSIEFSPDGKTIYAALAGEGSVCVFDTTTGKPVGTLKGTRELKWPMMAFSRDFHQLAVFGRDYEPGPMILGKMPKLLPARLGLWDLKTGKERHVIDLPLPDVFAGAFSPDGKLFAVVNARPPGNIIVIFDTATGQEQRRMRLIGNTKSLAFTFDGNTLAAGEIVGNINLKTASITLRSVATGELQAPLMEPRGAIVIGTKFRPGGKQLLTFGDDGVYWWDVAGGQSLRHFQDVQPMPTSPPLKGAVSLRGHPLSPDEKIFVTRGAVGELVLLDTATNQPLRTLKISKPPITTALFSPNGAKLFTGGGSTVTVWDVSSGKPLVELESNFVSNLALSPDGRWLASWAQAPLKQQSAEGKYDIHLWDLATGKLARRLTPRYGPASAGVFSADSTRLVIVGGELGQNFINAKNKGGMANEIQLWNVATGKEVRKFQRTPEHFVSLAISADGRMIATGKWKPGAGDAADPAVYLWDAATGTERGRIQGHESLVNTMDFSPDGRLLAATSADAPIYIWDVYALEKSQFTKVLTKEDKDSLWQQMADEDAAKAFQAVRELIARPVDAVTIFQDGLKRVPRATVQQMQKWIEDLGSDQFAVRQKAQVELDHYLAGHETLLANSIEKANTLELRQRLEATLNRLHPETLRRTRMLEVLERIGVGPARQFLETLASQKEDTELSREAAAGLKRLQQP